MVVLVRHVDRGGPVSGTERHEFPRGAPCSRGRRCGRCRVLHRSGRSAISGRPRPCTRRCRPAWPVTWASIQSAGKWDKLGGPHLYGKAKATLRKQMVKLVAGGPFEWFAREFYYAYVDHIPGPLLPADVVRARNYDRQTIEIAAKALAGAGNSIDAGANAGHILKSLTKLSPMGSHWAFEPIPRFAARLREKFPNVTVEQLALSDHNGVEDFNFLPEDPAYSSLLKRPDLEAGMEVQSLHVDVRRLDDCIPLGLPIAFIKIDVEGAEAAVLRGAAQLLGKFKPVVVFECGAMKLGDCISTLERAGLQISLLADYMNGRRRTSDEVKRIGCERGEFYYVASPDHAAETTA